MAHLVTQPEQKKAPLKEFFSRVFKQGRYGLSFMWGEKEVFFGITITPIHVYPVRRLPKVAKKGNIPAVVEYNL